MKPSDDPKADQLRNANISEPKMENQEMPFEVEEEVDYQNGEV